MVYMGDRRGANEMAMVGDEPEDGENLYERLFTVGEVVDFWEGSSVLGDRTAQTPGRLLLRRVFDFVFVFNFDFIFVGLCRCLYL